MPKKRGRGYLIFYVGPGCDDPVHVRFQCKELLAGRHQTQRHVYGLHSFCPPLVNFLRQGAEIGDSANKKKGVVSMG